MGDDGYDLTYIACGMGLDSTALLLCSEKGLHGCPRADLAIFADVDGQQPVDETAEPAYVLEHAWRMAERAAATPGAIPIHVAAAPRGLVAGLRRRLRTGHGRGANPPLFTREVKSKGAGLYGEEVTENADGQLRRQCTPTFKIEVQERYIRRLLGVRAVRRRKDGSWPVRVRGLIGIAADEADRIKPSTLGWVTLAHPMVDAGLKKADEAELLRANGWPVPQKSACKMCPYHGDAYWRWLKKEHPEEFEGACRFDEEFRQLRGMDAQTFVHSSRKPLRMVTFREERRDAFSNECSGLCAS